MFPPAVDELRRQGQDRVAELFEISNVVGPLLAMGRFDEHDTAVAAMVDRYRADGPPTFLHWTLFMLGYSALFQGRHSQTEQYFEESADVDIPENTVSLSKPIEARIALRRGDPPSAFQILRSHVDVLLDTDNLVVGSLACSEFVNMMVKIGHLAEAARMLGYLETSSSFGSLSSRTFVADAATEITADTAYAADQATGRALDRRQALAYVRDVLDRLLAERL